VTGRCAPKGSRFIFAAPKLFRHVIQARPGRVVISIDYVAQESAIAGVLAGARKFMAAYYAGDVHLECAKLCNMLRSDATPAEIKQVRKEFKICNLAVVYQAGIRRIAAQLGKSEPEARRYMATHRQEFWELHDFMAAVIEQAMHENVVVMQDGWRRALPSPFNPAAAANAPIQGTAAAIYRRGVVDLHRASLPMIATVHDSFVFECTFPDAADLIATATRILVEAGAAFLPGLRLKVSVDASRTLPHLAHLDIGPLADPETYAAYRRHLERAIRVKRAA
jgi:DNA polymerase-1